MKKITATDRTLLAHHARVLAFSHAPYVFGGATPHGFDCSGLALQAWATAGVTLPHNAEQQAALLGMSQTRSRLLPGDLVFYAGDDGTDKEPGHVAVFLDIVGGLFIVAQATDTAHGSEVIRMEKYAKPVGFGLVGH